MLIISLTSLYIISDEPVKAVDSGWWEDTNWDYCKKITIDHTQIDATLTYFPLAVHIENDGDLFGECQSDGDDILFTMDGDNETKLNHEIEYWNWDTGNSQVDTAIWVNITSVSSSADTIIWMYYGNGSASNQENIVGTWDSSYEAVYHMDSLLDSTSNDRDLTDGAGGTPTLVTGGIVGQCYDFEWSDSPKDYLDMPSDGILASESTFFIMSWFKPESDVSQLMPTIYSKGSGTTHAIIQMYHTAGDFETYIKDGSTPTTLTGGVINIGGWSFLATHDAGSLCEFVLWQLDDYIYDSGTHRTIDSNQNDAWIGYMNSALRTADGYIDECRLCSEDKSASYINATYHNMNQTTDFLTLGNEIEYSPSLSVPIVETDEATGVEETNATLRGHLPVNGSADTTCWVLWDDDTNLEDSPIGNVSKGVIDDDASFSHGVSSLTQGTVYYFDTKANNSEGWDTTGGQKNFLTKPNEPTGATCSAGEGWINVSWNTATGADKYHVRHKVGSSPTSTSDGTLFDEVTVLYANKSIGVGTHYFSIWSYAYETSPALSQFSDAYDTTSETEEGVPVWYSSSFNISATVTEATVDIETNPTTWIGGNPNCGTNIQNNFTFYQNGTATVQVKIGFNATNYTFVNYTTWASDGSNQYCANFTIDTWSSESMIEPKVAGDPVTILKDSLSGSSSFVFGVRIWMPKGVTTSGVLEDFAIMLVATDIG